MSIRRIVAALAAAGAITVLGVSTADAAPITCPDGQVATNLGAGNFACVNHGGNADASAKPKNG